MITTSSVELVQLPLLIVHLNVALVPAIKPVNVVLGEFKLVIVALPATTLHVPIPTIGAFADRVAVVILHKV